MPTPTDTHGRYVPDSGIGNKGFDLSLFTVNGDAPAGWRPFDETTSPMNKPIPASPSIAPNSAAIIAKLVSWGNPRDMIVAAGSSSVGSTLDWEHPIYFSKPTDPLYTIQPTTAGDNGGAALGGWDHLYGTQIRIPDGARGADGGDMHCHIVDLYNGYCHDFYHFQPNDAARQVPAGGGTVIAKAYCVMDLEGTGWALDNAGVPEGTITDAAGLSGAAGVIRPEEIAAGVIDHALAMIVKSTDGSVVLPGTGLAGSTDPTNAPPDGARIQLNMTNAEIDALSCSAWNKVLYKAMAKYGMYVRDTGSVSWSVQPSSSVPWYAFSLTDPWRTWAAGKLYYSSTPDYYFWEIHDPTARPDWATKLRVLDWTDSANR